MSGVVINSWLGYEIGADWDWHVDNGYQGGTDYIVAADRDVRSAVSGRATKLNDGLNGIAVTMDDGSGTKIVYLENKSYVGDFPRHVKINEVIAKTGLARRNPAGKLIVRWPHIHGILRGSRVRFERLVTTTAGGGGTPLPVPTEGPKSMSTIYYCTSNDKPAGQGGTIKMYALGGESPGTSANWLETTDSSIKAGWSTAHGAGVFLTKASYESFKARHLEPVKTAGAALVLDIPALAAALEAARPPMKLGVTLLGTATEEE